MRRLYDLCGWLVGFFRKKKQVLKVFSCSHGGAKGPFTIVVLDRECEMGDSPFCVHCTKTYLNRFSVLCSECDMPIFPGNAVADSGHADGRFVHNTEDCSIPGAYLGMWSEGGLIHFSELGNVT